MPPRDWDATSYERVSAPLEAMGRDVLDRLDLRGDERVLDAGCGTGRVTAALLERLPRGEVVAVDGSPAMVEAVRERLGDRVERASPTSSSWSSTGRSTRSSRPRPSTGSPTTSGCSRGCSTLLVPGGRLVAQCGGAGNIAALDAAAELVAEREPFAAALAGWSGPWNFAAAGETAERLRRLGWADVWTWYQQVRVEPEDPHEYIGTVALGSHLDRLEPEQRGPFIDAVLAELDEPVVEYRRLNILARRPS